MAPAGRTEQRRAAIQRTLAQRHGRNPGTAAITEATLGLWCEAAGILIPMVGGRGVDALFTRSLQLASPAFPWLAAAVEPGDGAGPQADFLARLKGRDPDEAIEASLALMVTFTELLATMIGASLTDRLLNPVWGSASAESAEETAS